MKKRILLLAFMVLGLGILPLSAQRYLTEVFTDVTVNSEVTYGQNISIIQGGLDTVPLMMDVYHPTGDTMSERPMVFLAHSGSFLPPPFNGACNGTRKDSSVVEMCTLLAKRGFVAVAFSYRQGWNPLGNQEDRTGGLLRAAYRGIQDARTCVRFFRMDADMMGNNYAIDVDRTIIGGIGTGGYISLGAAYLDSYDEINLPKFIDPTTAPNFVSYVDTMVWGDMEAIRAKPGCIPNHASYYSGFSAAFNMGGALGDKTWMEAGEMSLVSFHVPSDPFAPYDDGQVIVPTTGGFVVDVTGGRGAQFRADSLGLNAIFPGTYTDPYSTEAATKNEGFDGFFPFQRPSPESGPWDWWDSNAAGCDSTTNANNLLTNPDMSAMKGRTYIDTVLNYMVPRLACALGIGQNCALTTAEEQVEQNSVLVYPNPAEGFVYIRSNDAGNNIHSVQVIDANGRMVQNSQGLKLTEYKIEREDLASGIYFMKVRTRKGVVTKKVILK